MRTLASIQKIREVNKHPNADVLDLAKVLGWNVVVKRNEFKVGDWCVYCEIDSILPEKPVFEFLRNKNFRIRTIKLRGAVSQGICFPVQILPEYIQHNLVEGMDLTEILGITKYEPPVPVQLQGLVKGAFPRFLHKTDETRIQVLQDLIEGLMAEDPEFYLAEKLDGTSMTVYQKEGFGVCSRNMDLTESEENTYWQVAKKLNLPIKLPEGFGVQGELIGPHIQKNKYALKDCIFHAFNIVDIGTGKYLDLEDFLKFCNNLNIPTVPILKKAHLSEFGRTYDEIMENLIKFSQRKSVLNSNPIEGIVLRPVHEMETFKHGRISFKVINPDFLLKFDDA